MSLNYSKTTSSNIATNNKTTPSFTAMRKLFVSCVFAASSIAHAQTDTCLDNLKGNFYNGARTTPNHVFSVQSANNSWQFKRPESPDADKEKLFKYSFGHENTASAKPIQNERLPSLGNALFVQYLDKAADIQGIRYECGLVTDEFYLMAVDLTEASPHLISNMIMMKKALAQDKNYKAQPSSKEINEMRKQKYFSGQPFHLEGVTSGVVSLALQKQ